MSTPRPSFTTNNRNSYIWTQPKPSITISSQSPKNIDTGLHDSRSEPEECGCNMRSYEFDFSRYKKLASQEYQLRNEIMKINDEMKELLSRMLDSTCKSEEETMQYIYQVANEQSAAPIAQCRQLTAAVDPPTESPIKSAINCYELNDVCGNPNRFRCCANNTPHIEPAEPVDFTRVPDTDIPWNKPFMGRSEYMDTIGKLGMSNLKSEKQCIEPMSPSRKRWTNKNF